MLHISTPQPVQSGFGLNKWYIILTSVPFFSVLVLFPSWLDEPTEAVHFLLICLGEQSGTERALEHGRFKPNIDARLNDLKLTLGPELRIVYPLILNFAVSGDLELSGMVHPKYIRPKGILTFENGEVNLVATQVSLTALSPWLAYLYFIGAYIRFDMVIMALHSVLNCRLD